MLPLTPACKMMLLVSTFLVAAQAPFTHVELGRRSDTNSTARAGTVKLDTMVQLGSSDTQALYPLKVLPDSTPCGLADIIRTAGWPKMNITKVSSNSSSERGYLLGFHQPEGYLALTTGDPKIVPVYSYPGIKYITFDILCASARGTVYDQSSYICGIAPSTPMIPSNKTQCVIHGDQGFKITQDCDPAAMKAEYLWEIRPGTSVK